MRLIDADALMQCCSNTKSKTISNNDIARFPTIEKPKKGEWIKREGLYQCSACECFFVVGTPFCPFCGADMREEKKK